MLYKAVLIKVCSFFNFLLAHSLLSWDVLCDQHSGILLYETEGPFLCFFINYEPCLLPHGVVTDLHVRWNSATFVAFRIWLITSFGVFSNLCPETDANEVHLCVFSLL